MMGQIDQVLADTQRLVAAPKHPGLKSPPAGHRNYEAVAGRHERCSSTPPARRGSPRRWRPRLPVEGRAADQPQVWQVMQLKAASSWRTVVSRQRPQPGVSSACHNAVQYQLGGMSYVLDGELLFTMAARPARRASGAKCCCARTAWWWGASGQRHADQRDVQGKIQTLRAPKRYTR